MRAFGVLGLALALCAFCATPFARAAASTTAAYQVIAHPGVAVSGVDRKFLEDALLKKITRWPTGDVVRPVDLTPRSPVRRKFSEEVLKRSVEAVKNYWQQRIFAGRDLPPPELDTDDDVVRYVTQHEGALGYVSGAADLKGAKVLTVK
jgi:hypothetical protein